MAATINRFNRWNRPDYSMNFYAPEVFIPDFQAWSGLLQKQQLAYDQALSVRNKLPAYLPHREELAAQYRTQTQQGVDAITTAYTEKGVQAGNRSMRDFGQNLSTQWQPGGLAHELQKEYEEYGAAQTRIDTYYKDQKAENSANRQYSLSLLDKAAKQELKQNPQTGMYTRAGLNPSLFPYVDIADEALKVVKEIKGSGTSSIVSMSPAWFQKIQSEDVVTPETVKAVTDALLQQPKYQQQLAIETIQAKGQYTPEQLTKLTEQRKERIGSGVDKTLAQIEALASGKDKDKRSLQSQLKEAGYYDGDIDGDFGKASKEALSKYKDDMLAKRDQRVTSVSADKMIEDNIKASYTAPLIEAFSRETIKKDIIYNKQWDLQVRMANQRKGTQDLITAMQSLKDPATTNFLTSPGLSKPMETFDKIKTNYQQMYSDAKSTFDNTVQWSGLSGIIGTSAPNKVHEVTNARMKSGTYEEFKANMADLGYTVAMDNEVQNIWNFYNTSGSDAIRSSYLTMQDAKNNVDNATNAEVALTTKYVSTPEGKKQLDRIREKHNLQNLSEADLIQEVVTNQSKYKPSHSQLLAGRGVSVSATLKGAVGEVGSFISARDTYVNKNKVDFPVSLRGHAINAVRGEGSELEKVIIDDIVSGNTVGYTGDDKPLVFKSLDGKTEFTDADVKLNEGSNLRFNVDASGITYYVTGRSTDGKNTPVSAVVKAPPEHYDRLRTMALQMKKEAAESGDNATDATADALYAITTKGPRFGNAVEDAMTITDGNSRQLYDVIDVQRSTAGDVKTFGNNTRIKGTPVGTEWETGGNTYQKFKVKDSTGKQAYMMTMKTNAGWAPLPNKSGGMYFNTSQEAEAPVWTIEMMKQIPTEINQQKIKVTNTSLEDASRLMQGVAPLIQQFGQQQDDNNDTNDD